MFGSLLREDAVLTQTFFIVLNCCVVELQTSVFRVFQRLKSWNYILLGKKNAKHWGNLKRKAYGIDENLLRTTNLQENSSNIFRIAEQSIFLRSKVA